MKAIRLSALAAFGALGSLGLISATPASATPGQCATIHSSEMAGCGQDVGCQAGATMRYFQCLQEEARENS